MIERKLCEHRTACRLLPDADADAADETVHRALPDTEGVRRAVEACLIVDTVQMCVDQLGLRLDKAAALVLDTFSILRRERFRPCIAVAAHDVSARIINAVFRAESADLCDEINIVAAFSRPCAVDAEVSLFALSAAVCKSGAALHIACRKTDTPLRRYLQVMTDLHRMIVHMEIRIVLIAAGLAAVKTYPCPRLLRR